MKPKKEQLPQVNGVTVHCAHAALVDISKLKGYPKNNKRHPEAQLDLLCKAIKAQGVRCPITVSHESGYIVRGHARLEAARRLGLKQYPVDYQHYASEAAERADRIADNKISELAEWDFSNLREELSDLDTGEFDPGITGFCEKEIEKIMTYDSVGTLESAIKESEEWQETEDAAEKAAKKIHENIDKIKDKYPGAFTKAQAIIHDADHHEVIIISDPALKDFLAELHRYAVAGDPSPLSRILEATHTL